MWTRVLLVLFAGFFVWQTWAFLRHNPDALAEDNVRRSLPVLGWIIAFLLLVLLAACWILRMYG